MLTHSILRKAVWTIRNHYQGNRTLSEQQSALCRHGQTEVAAGITGYSAICPATACKADGLRMAKGLPVATPVNTRDC